MTEEKQDRDRPILGDRMSSKMLYIVLICSMFKGALTPVSWAVLLPVLNVLSVKDRLSS